MTNIPGFRAAGIAWENKEAYPEVERCDDGDCGDCAECLAERAQDEADEYADMQRKERRWERD